MIDTHCHLDAPEFAADREAVVQRAQQAGVQALVVPAVMPSTFADAQAAAKACQQHGVVGAYALGSHPLYVHQVPANAVQRLHDALQQHQHDPALVAVGEIGLDHFVPHLQDDASRAAQDQLYAQQLQLATAFHLPVILHVRRSADSLLKHLRAMRSQGRPLTGGIAHAFNGSLQQAHAFLDLGFKLGFGGAMTFDRALQIRRLAQQLPDDAIVLETDAPDIPPHWLYQTAQAREKGVPNQRNEPAELPRIAQTLMALRGWDMPRTCEKTTHNALAALPKLSALITRQNKTLGEHP